MLSLVELRVTFYADIQEFVQCMKNKNGKSVNIIKNVSAGNKYYNRYTKIQNCVWDVW